MMLSQISEVHIYRAALLKVMYEYVKSLHDKPSNRYKLSLLRTIKSEESVKIQENLYLFDQITASILRNAGNGNLKRAFHFLVVLNWLTQQTQKQIDSIDFLEVLLEQKRN
ncbi:hypothetical protein [Saccharibacillus brassicae]|uniref:Uncharacterized protein n=1 Tax=Saccharibacillus brassicae TaxID=2583377 RepID=A0A4Y6UXZ0_SACBS|nr:hypothetical protein [Saccharibacillus brassicae]QDH22004.1 hypothetical protein FFV09_14830 [Saccharibacillus brassicae]